MTTKTYTRDAATALLRKAGVNKDAYGMHLAKQADGRFTVTLPTAVKPLDRPVAKPVAKPAPKVWKAKAKSAAKKAAKANGHARVTISSTARALIMAGKKNDEIFKALQKQFKLDDSKKYYPTWYRGELRRQGIKVPTHQA